MKITIALGFFNPCPPLRGGGVERMWYQLAQEFSELGHTVSIISRTWPGLPKREKLGNLQHIRVPGFNHRRRLITNLFLDVLWSFRILPSFPKADILITNSIFLPLLSSLFKFCGITVVNLNRYPKGQLRWYSRVGCIQTPSTAIARVAMEQAPALASRICVIPNAANLSSLFSIARSKEDGPLVIGFLGRVHPEKGIDLLIRAADELLKESDLPLWKFAITGPYRTYEGGGGVDYYQHLHTQAAHLKDHVEFLPPVFSYAEIVSRYAGMDIFCYPSIAEKGETFGIAVLEAMAAELPVVTSNLQCFTDLVDEGQNGYFFDYSHPDAPVKLAAALMLLLRDADRRNTMGRAARAKARSLDSRNIAIQHLDCFKKLLDSPL
ncbi:MAG: glycosyltransferase family 4 protein [Chthoniobacterales bacterium]